MDLRRYHASADPDDLALHTELVQTMYHELDRFVRVDAPDPDSNSAVLTSRLGPENVLL